MLKFEICTLRLDDHAKYIQLITIRMRKKVIELKNKRFDFKKQCLQNQQEDSVADSPYRKCTIDQQWNDEPLDTLKHSIMIPGSSSQA